jgi:hypothetical protein
MLNKNVSMPHPVLGVPDDMDGSFTIRFKLCYDRLLKSYIFKEIQINITNVYVQQLYENGLVEHLLKIKCIPTYKSWVFKGVTDIQIPEDEVDLVIEIEAFLLAKNKITGYQHDSFNLLFKDVDFTLNKGDIIATTGTKRIPVSKDNEKVSLGSIFRFSKIDRTDHDQELRFDLDEDQILIKYPSSNLDFDPITLLFDKKQGLPYTALNLYIIPALTEAFDALDQQEDKNLFNDKRWALALDILLPQAERSDDPFISAQKVLGTEIPINLAFEEIIKSKKIQL